MPNEHPPPPIDRAAAAPTEDRGILLPVPLRTPDAGASRWLLGQARRARLQIALCVGAGFANGLLLVAQAALIALIIHQAILDGAVRSALLPYLLALVGIYAARAGLVWAGEVAGFAASARVKAALRHELANHLLALGPAYAATRHSGALAAVLMEQVEALDGFFARFLPQLAIAILIPAAILAAVFPVDWIAGLILLLTAPLIPLFMALIGMGAASASREQFRTLARMSGHFLDRLQGLTTLKLFGQAQRELAVIARVADEFRQRTMGVLRIAFLSSAVLEFFASVSIAILAIYVGLSLVGYLQLGPGPELSLGTGLFLLLLAPDFYQPLRQLALHYHDRAAALGAAHEILTVLEAKVPERGRRRLDLGGRAPRIRFDRVSFAFQDGHRPALTGLSFDVAPGERVALVGSSGSGKSTAIALLLGFLVPDGGRIEIDGADIGEVDPEDLRRNIAWIGQSAHLFHGTIRDNIRLGRPDAGDSEIGRAAAEAGVTAFAAALPDGLDTPVGERGFGLSGGQAQRVALARAFLKDAPLLLLDEPTASLDAESERLVLAGLERLARGRTVVIATHSPLGRRWADRVIRIAHGRLAVEAEPARPEEPS